MKTNKNEREQKDWTEKIFKGAFIVFLGLLIVISASGCVANLNGTLGIGEDAITEAGEMVTRRGPGVDYPHDSTTLEVDEKATATRGVVNPRD